MGLYKRKRIDYSSIQKKITRSEVMWSPPIWKAPFSAISSLLHLHRTPSLVPPDAPIDDKNDRRDSHKKSTAHSRGKVILKRVLYR